MKKMTRALLLPALLWTVLPMAFADISGTATLSAGGNFSFDRGTNVASGGDISFSGTSVSFVGSAKGVLSALTGATNYSVTSELVATIVLESPQVTNAPIQESSLSSGSIIILQTNGGNPAKLMITSASASAISFEYTTFNVTASGGGTSANPPVITAVLNNSSQIPSGFANGGIAPSSLFAIQGTGMATPGTVPVLQDSTQGLPATLNGATISVSAGGKTYTPPIWYASPTAIAAVLPAATPVGPATLTVSYNGTPSAAFNITVVASAYGIDVYNGNTAVAQDPTSPTGAVFTPTSSAKPGQFVTLWGTGLGADPGDPDGSYTGTPHTVATPVQIYVGGVQATNISYAGASVYPGVSVIQFQIPQGVPNGCYVPVVVLTGSGAASVVSNSPTFAIMNNGGECSEPLTGVTGSQTTDVNIRAGDVLIGSLSEPSIGAYNLASAGFDKVTGTVTSGSSSTSGSVSIGGCTITEITSSSSSGGSASLTITYLDAGTLTLQGPAGSYPLPEIAKGEYSSQLPASAVPSTGGAFVFSNGNGGADVGAFTATVNMPNPILNWTNQSAAATVTRSQGLLVTWLGGSPGSYVYISGSSASGTGLVGGFSCYAPQSALQFTVPAYVLSVLPAGQGSVLLENLTAYTTFTAPGLDYGYGIGFTGISVVAKFQ